MSVILFLHLWQQFVFVIFGWDSVVNRYEHGVYPFFAHMELDVHSLHMLSAGGADERSGRSHPMHGFARYVEGWEVIAVSTMMYWWFFCHF